LWSGRKKRYGFSAEIIAKCQSCKFDLHNTYSSPRLSEYKTKETPDIGGHDMIDNELIIMVLVIPLTSLPTSSFTLKIFSCTFLDREEARQTKCPGLSYLMRGIRQRWTNYSGSSTVEMAKSSKR
jgi:hypothetical protein